jgi:tetratricopeptide (TPR) repeat protein
MKVTLLKAAVIVLAFLFLTGCFASKRTVPLAYKKPVENQAVPFKSDDRYYYFIEAQLQKKKGNLAEAIQFLHKAVAVDPEAIYLQKELVKLYLEQKDKEKALGAVKKIIEKNPNDAEALVMHGKIEQGLEHFENAKEAYKKVIAIDPEQQDIYFLLGGLYLDENDPVKALPVYKQLVEHFPDSYAGHYYIGKILLEQGHFTKAENEFQKTLELEPDLLEPRFELVKLYRSAGKEKKIPELYKYILKRDAKNIRAAMELGYYYHQAGQANEAEKLFQKLGERSQTEKEVIREVLQLYLDQEKYDAAIITLEGMLKGAPDSSDIHYVEGIAYDGKKDKDMSMKHFKKVKPSSNFYENAAIHIAYLYQEQGKIVEAIDHLHVVINTVSDNPEMFLYLGSFYEEIEEFEKAEKAIKRGLEIDSENARLYFRLGVIYDKSGKKEECIETMKTVISLEPKNSNALNYLGYTYADLGHNLDEAEHLIKEALKHKPDDGYITDSLGWVYFKKGLFKKALKFLEKAVKLVPDDPTILEHLGDTCVEVNDKKSALEYYKRSLLNKKKDKTELENKIKELTEKGPEA